MDQIYLKVNALAVNESFVRGTIASCAARVNPTIDVISDIKTAVSEAVTNAIVHAYEMDESKEIEVIASIDRDVLRVEVKDHGIGIENVAEAMTDFYTTKSFEERSGLGFTIMASFMDSLVVASEPGQGTSVTMTKKLKNRQVL